MLDAAREVTEFGTGRQRGDLERDRVLALALMRSIEIIGEAASKVSPEVQAKHPNVPWSDIIGMRHRLIHAYFEIDLGRVCDTLATDLPPLIVQLERILSD
ncbi:MAG: HepT-like ribonuclease domain-containing protein [Bryobacteraceae bacterium]